MDLVRRHGWHAAVAGGLAALAAFLVADALVVTETIWCATLAAATAAGATAFARAPRGVRRPWVPLVAALAALLVANLLSHPWWAPPTAAPVADLLAIVAFPLLGLAIFGMSHAQVPGGDRESALDSAIVMVAMATVLATTVHHGGPVAGVSRLGWSLHAVVAPLLTSGIVAASLRLLFVGRTRSPAAWLIVSAATAALLGNITRAHLVAEGSYARGTWTDVFILAAYVAVVLALLHPSSDELLTPVPLRDQRMTHARLAVLGGALVTLPATLVFGISRDELLTGAGTVLVALLVLWRLSALAVERDRSRRALQGRAERQEALAELGRLALDERDLDALRADAVRRCRTLLAIERCEVTIPPDPVDARTTVVPIGQDDHALLAVHDGAPAPDDVAFLRMVGYLLTVALDRRGGEDALRWAATHDPLTGLPNRAHLLDRLAASVVEARPGEVEVLYLDLDGFKEVNDTHGHRIGDQLLTAVAGRLRHAVRAEDTVGRLGGDEFLVIRHLPGQEADDLPRRIEAAIERPFEVEGHVLRIGVSVGTAAVWSDAEPAGALLARADADMYRAKRAGRGRRSAAVRVG